MKKVSKKGSKGKKLDGKALAAKRKPRDSVAQFIKDELNAGRTDVDKILERAKAEFKGKNPTRGYVRYLAKTIGNKAVAYVPKAKAKGKSTKKTSTKKTAAADPAS